MDKFDNPILNLDLDQKKVRGMTAAVILVIPSVLVVGLLFLLVSFRSRVEGTVARLASLLPVGYAFAAGMVASVNPCGVMMLPAYILHQVGAVESAHQDKKLVTQRVVKGFVTALMVTVGFVFIFAAVGGIITLGGQWLVKIFPYAGFLIGLAMLGAGLWMLISHRTFGITAAGRLHINPRRNLGNMFVFGVIYALGSLSCTLPIFLVVVGSALASGSAALSISQFVGYALGMGSVILIVTQTAVLFQMTVTRWLQSFSSFVHRFNALFMVGAGIYLVFYWIFIAGLR